ncbi:MAG TPA: hypothetical protein VHF26_22600, partial [Trebonia sp.]|nr:hypothetical protein [Trebonia sp.]
MNAGVSVPSRGADPGFQGIDPGKLAQLMAVLGHGVSGARPLAQSYVTQFSRLGLDTSGVQRLLADYAWAAAQQPMLSRRHTLAGNQPSGAFTDGMATVGAGALEYTTSSAAAKAGTAAAQETAALLTTGKDGAAARQLAGLAQHSGDRDYISAYWDWFREHTDALRLLLPVSYAAYFEAVLRGVSVKTPGGYRAPLYSEDEIRQLASRLDDAVSELKDVSNWWAGRAAELAKAARDSADLYGARSAEAAAAEKAFGDAEAAEAAARESYEIFETMMNTALDAIVSGAADGADVATVTDYTGAADRISEARAAAVEVYQALRGAQPVNAAKVLAAEAKTVNAAVRAVRAARAAASDADTVRVAEARSDAAAAEAAEALRDAEDAEAYWAAAGPGFAAAAEDAAAGYRVTASQDLPAVSDNLDRKDFASVFDGPRTPGFTRVAPLLDSPVGRAGGRALQVLGAAADVYTIVDPSQNALGGATTERVMAGANLAAMGTGDGTVAGLIAANASLDWVPAAGEVVMIGTAAYFVGDLIYQNRQAIGHALSWTGHQTAHYFDDARHET